MKNAERKKIVLEAFAGILDKVYPDNEQVSIEEAKAIVGIDGALDIIKSALAVPSVEAAPEPTVVAVDEEDE